MDKVQKLQMEVFSLMNSNVKTPKQTSSRTSTSLKSIGDRLKGKDGRIRGNLMGKRVNHSARSVISPDVNMDVDELGVPESIATILTVPEQVTAHNSAALERRVHIGANHINGADCIITGNNTVVSLEQCKARTSIRLQHGWIVMRYLQDGDAVIFNRQPSLHKMSMMTHRARIVQGGTFRLHLSVVTCYNADFDGDEMNMHVPQSPAAILEATSLMSVSAQLISVASNKPCITIVQDALLGMYILSLPETRVTRSVFMRLAGWLRHPLRPWYTLQCDTDVISGRCVASLLFPSTFCYKKDDIVIMNGQLLKGTMTKSALGSSSGGIVDTLYRDYGVSITMHFLSDVQRLTKEFLLTIGFAVGISDCTLKDQSRVAASISNSLAAVKQIQAHPLASVHKQRAEDAIQSILSKTLMNVSSLVSDAMDDKNAIKHLVMSGSKGNSLNLSQIAGCVGQQTVEGGRTCAHTMRSLPHFAQHDSGCASRGFVQASYLQGLSPTEYFFHMMGGREGLVDTSVKTATTGYLQRRLVKAMEDNTVEYDGTVRTADGNIVEFEYGVDGYDASRVERMSAHCLEWSAQEICAHVQNERYASICVALQMDAWVEGGRQILLMPLNVKRMVDNVETSIHVVSEEDAEQRVLQTVHALKVDNVCWSYLIAIHLAPRVICSRRASWECLNALCSRIETATRDAKVNAGEAVGCIAAQSIGESGTQMTLNSFHAAGITHSHLVYGIPRFKALIDLSHVAGSMRLFVSSEEAAKNVDRALVHIRLVDVVEQNSTTFIWDPADDAIEDDELMISTFYGVYARPQCSEWCVRMQLNKDQMKDRGLTPYNIVKALQKRNLHICVSDTNAIAWIVRLRGPPGIEKHDLQLLHAETMRTRVCGVPAITNACTSQINVQMSPGVKESAWVVDTHGISLSRAALCKDVQIYKTRLNSVHEAYRVFGIEVCAAVLYTEILTCITHDGTYLDPRHLAHVTNTMCFRAEPMSFTRHGINRVEQSAHLQFGFEETQKLIADAAMFGKVDAGRGVTQSVIFGQPANVGTGKLETRIPLSKFTAAPDHEVSTKQKRGPQLCKSRRTRTTHAAEEKIDDEKLPTIEFVDSRVWRPCERKPKHNAKDYVPPSP